MATLVDGGDGGIMAINPSAVVDWLCVEDSSGPTSESTM